MSKITLKIDTSLNKKALQEFEKIYNEELQKNEKRKVRFLSRKPVQTC